MVIWTRWGILGLLIPVVLIFLAEEIIAPRRLDSSMPMPVFKVIDQSQGGATAEELQEFKAAQLTKSIQQLKAVKRAKNIGFAIGCMVAAGVLWPIGRWMNEKELSLFVKSRPEESVVLKKWSEHTLFFIPLEYWAFIWPAIGLVKLIS